MSTYFINIQKDRQLVMQFSPNAPPLGVGWKFKHPSSPFADTRNFHPFVSPRKNFWVRERGKAISLQAKDGGNG
ncbi:MAG: hypothetical protein IMHGJWDQ_001814 [Candidatus Fervidibacter sp.]